MIKSPSIKSSLTAFLLVLMLLSVLLSGCGHNYTQQEMVGVFKTDDSKTETLHLDADGTLRKTLGDFGTFSGKWERVSTDGIYTMLNDPPYNVNPTYYKILSRDELKPLLSEEALKMGISSPVLKRVK